MVGLYLIVGVLYLPWVSALFSQLSSVNESYWIGNVDWRRTHYEAILRILGGEAESRLLGFSLRNLLFTLSGLMLLMGIVQHALRHKFEKPYLLIWLWATIPFVLATLPGLTIGGIKLPFRSIFFWRYLIGSAIPMSMVIVHSAQKFHRNLMFLTLTAILTLSVIIDLMTFTRVPYSFREEYRNNVISSIRIDNDLVTVLPSFAEVLYYRNRNNLKNDLLVLPEGLVQFSGKSLLDSYVENGVVTIGESGRVNFELRRDDSGQIKTLRHN